ncbi:addiction module protein [Tautonia rosea]|uniref:addiction module protein n=1 Tax=Tautonia rosea TaxID=2728037 RepID=UPI001472FCDA|nr:addiction module protein [Tautonia rosea]
MATKMQELGIDRLSADERLDLMLELWDSLASEPGRTHLTPAQQRELQRRLADHDANPDDVISWEEIKAQALARFSAR